MSRGALLAFTIIVVTIVLVAVGVFFPNTSAFASASGVPSAVRRPSSPQEAVETLVQEISRKDWPVAYNSLANKNEFTEQDFVRDLTGTHPSLRSYASLDGFDLHPLHASADAADVRVDLTWSEVVGTYHEVRDMRVIREGDE